jgi:Beta-lactamase enzyme family
VEGMPARRAKASRTARAAATAALLAALQGCDAYGSAPHTLTRTSPASAGSLAAGNRTSPASVGSSASGDRGGRSSYPASPSSAPRQNPLGTTAASYVGSRSGTVVAAVYDVAAGQMWTLGPQHPQAEASIVKLDILETLYAQQGNGPALAGTDQSLAQQMMEDSDNAAATSLWNAVGGPKRIQSFNTAAGLTHTLPSSCVICPGFAWPGWGLTTTTPADQIALLRELIEPSTLLTDAQRQNALEFMENVTPGQRWGVTGGVPPQATVALKNGWLPLNSARTDWQINSIGWVKGSGRNYLMAVLTTGNPTEQYGIDTTSRLSAMVWGNLR